MPKQKIINTKKNKIQLVSLLLLCHLSYLQSFFHQLLDRSGHQASFHLKFMNRFPDVALSLSPQAPVNGDTPPAEGLSENDSGVELTNENSPLTAAEPPSPFSPKQNGDAASPQGNVCCDWSLRRWWCGATFHLKHLKNIKRDSYCSTFYPQSSNFLHSSFKTLTL